MTHPCAAPECTAPVSDDRLMCLDCWRRLPIALQRAVNSTWRNVRRDTQAYREARDAAVQWHADNPINQKPGLF